MAADREHSTLNVNCAVSDKQCLYEQAENTLLCCSVFLRASQIAVVSLACIAHIELNSYVCHQHIKRPHSYQGRAVAKTGLTF